MSYYINEKIYLILNLTKQFNKFFKLLKNFNQ